MMATSLLREILPEVYADLEMIVAADDDSALTRQLPTLAIVGGCGCGDAFCASFYTGPRPRGAWSDEGFHRTLADADTVLVSAVDVVDSAIRYVEIIDARTEAGQRVAGILQALRADRL